mmetsp:Transcript_7932/g.17050  ORF Transcript_7932/g.17050 Transcript_7932/m.17050 type:complete len:90 (+) Transcript_7932:89-358(+)
MIGSMVVFFVYILCRFVFSTNKIPLLQYYFPPSTCDNVIRRLPQHNDMSNISMLLTQNKAYFALHHFEKAEKSPYRGLSLRFCPGTHLY